MPARILQFPSTLEMLDRHGRNKLARWWTDAMQQAADATLAEYEKERAARGRPTMTEAMAQRGDPPRTR